MKHLAIRKTLQAFAGATLLAVSPLAFADGGDSNADAAANFTRVVQDAQAAIIKVPVNQQGDELTTAAELRVYAGSPVAEASTSIETAFNAATPTTGVPQVTSDDISRDSSTWGWFGYGNNGWYNNYYSSYRPYYYYGGSYYNYSNPYCYNDYSYSGSYYGYRYYYYPRWY